MTEWLLVRHAQAQRAAGGGDDLSRPLTPHGQSQAAGLGLWLKARNIVPAQVLCSPALRARMTLEGAQTALGEQLDTAIVPAIYGAAATTLLDVLTHQPGAGPIMLVGHNPGLSVLLVALCDQRHAPPGGMTPGTLARISFAADTGPGRGQLLERFAP